ncbi:MAG TPA: DUF2087 domain-containing protein [Candidatus Limnocylindrales bacterium]
MNEKILETFLKDGRLVAIPARAGKRRVILEYIVCAFEPGVKYTEKEVNAVLRAFYEVDYVSLRRYLIDAWLMERADGLYWRTGGHLDAGH